MFNKLALIVSYLLCFFFMFSALYSVYSGNIGFLVIEVPAVAVCFGIVCKLMDNSWDQ